MSTYRYAMENNGRINSRRRELKLIGQYINDALRQPTIPAEVAERIRPALAVIPVLDQAFCDGYVSAGYQYDDNDVRNQLDELCDRLQDDDPQRTGSTLKEEIEAEVAAEVAKRHADGLLEGVIDLLDDEMAAVIWPDSLPRHERREGLRTEIRDMHCEDAEAERHGEFDDRD